MAASLSAEAFGLDSDWRKRESSLLGESLLQKGMQFKN
jgi:hypothetical protein